MKVLFTIVVAALCLAYQVTAGALRVRTMLPSCQGNYYTINGKCYKGAYKIPAGSYYKYQRTCYSKKPSWFVYNNCCYATRVECWMNYCMGDYYQDSTGSWWEVKDKQADGWYIIYNNMCYFKEPTWVVYNNRCWEMQTECACGYNY